MQQRVFNDPKIEVVWNTQAVEAVGDNDKLNGVRVLDAKSGTERVLTASGLFYAIGMSFISFSPSYYTFISLLNTFFIKKNTRTQRNRKPQTKPNNQIITNNDH